MQFVTNFSVFFAQILSPENSNWLEIWYQDLFQEEAQQQNKNYKKRKTEQFFRLREKNPVLLVTFFLKKFASFHNLEENTFSEVLNKVSKIYPWMFDPKPFIAKYVDRKGSVAQTPAIAHTRVNPKSEKLIFVSSGLNQNNGENRGRNNDGTQDHRISTQPAVINTHHLSEIPPKIKKSV